MQQDSLPKESDSSRYSAPNLHKMTPGRHRDPGFTSHANFVQTTSNMDHHNVPALPSYLCRPYQPGLRSIAPSPMVMRGSPSIPGAYPSPRFINNASQRNPVKRSSTHKKKVALFQGNFVLDCPVPTRLMEASARKDKEFSMMRYSAVTCDPNDFAANKYTLRPQLMNRETELFIVMTMYNEDEVLFCRTMHGVMKNIAHLCSRSRSRVWDTEGWKKVVVCIVADGRKKCDPRVMDVLTTMGVYQKGIAKNMYTTQVSVDSDMKVRGAEKGIVPVQILFCLKEQNAKKINSHRWFFNAFGPILQPNICVLLDVGTRPGNSSIYHLWKAFDANEDVGGACGEICVMKGTACVDLLNPLVAAQNFEYKMSNILDKPLESVFGYISVLPGAFSAYRYAALQNDANGVGPLQKYFLGEKHDETDNADIFTANMYLAEDRILCFELIAKKHQKWVLKYVQTAFGETDCPDQLPEFISQRRRWLNGSFFAAVYSQWHFSRIWTSPEMDPFGNGWGDCIFLSLRYLYIFLFIASFICSMGNRPQGSKWMFIISVIAYGLIMVYTSFAGAWLAYKSFQQGMNTAGWDPNNALGNFSLLLGQPGFRNVVISLLATYGLYIIASVLYLDPWHMVTSFSQYLFLLPTYVNILNVYAFCNIHDVSWGTKGDNATPMDLGVASKAMITEKGVEAVEVELEDGIDAIDRDYDQALESLMMKPEAIRESRAPKTKQDDYYRGFRTRLVLTWIGCNAMLVAFVTSGSFQSFLSNSEQKQLPDDYSNAIGTAYTGFILWMVAAMAAFRFLGSLLYLTLRCFNFLKQSRIVLTSNRSASKGLFKKPDWDLAASHFEHAATNFKIAQSYKLAVGAYEKASDAYFKSDSIHLAGKALENAAFILNQNLKDPKRAASAYQRASNYFMAQGSIDRAAEQLDKAGRALENVDMNESYEMYSKACSLYEQEDRGRFAIEIFKKAISLLIRNKKYDKAIDMLKRESVILQKFTARSQLYKANLSILILIFAIGDDVEAGKQFNSMCGNDPGFAQSEEAEIADNLLKAFDERDQDLLVKTTKSQHITFLDNEVIKLARMLVVPGEVMSPASLNRHEINGGGSSNVRPLSHYQGAAADSSVRGMSHAQARDALYSRPGPPAANYVDDDDEEELR
ncbi:hypothetical protein [Parasitella parasitica]|uniref:chitin synthase n=1 Tax=Parasitella parasitica TaxID=35722 RepID=A0A0B7NGQ6_9FUNG|nr:hypothetical protein [Parasitella parasitica]